MAQKIKSLHSITIEKCQFRTQFQYNINTNHISIGTTHFYQDPDKTKEYYKENNKKNIKEYQKDNKDKNKQYKKQYYEDNRNPNVLKMGSKEHRIMLSCQNQKINREDFNGFISDQKYCYKFNNKCREQNREKYDRKCFICDKLEIENNQKLSVHHIDMNKDQGCNSEWQLVPLCSKCHGITHNKLWESRLKYLIGNY